MKLTLGKKMLAGFGIVLLLMVVSATLSYRETAGTIAIKDYLLQNRVPTIDATRQLQRDLNQAASKARQAALAGNDGARREAAKKLMDDIWAQVDKDLIQLDALAPRWTVQENRDRLAEVHRLLPQVKEFHYRAVEMATGRGDSIARAGNFLADKGTVTNDQAKKQLDDMAASFEDRMKEVSHELDSSLSKIMWILLTATGVALIGGIGIALFTSRGIVSATTSAVHFANAIAGGDLAQNDMAVRGQDEIADLVRALNKMKASLREKAAATSRMVGLADKTAVNLMFADREMKIQYLNPTSMRALERLEQYLPVKAVDILGQSIDVFHKDPGKQRRVLNDTRSLPTRPSSTLGRKRSIWSPMPCMTRTRTTWARLRPGTSSPRRSKSRR